MLSVRVFLESFTESTVESKPIDSTVDLFCYDFDESCRWYNLDGLIFLDAMDWFQGTGSLDGNRLKVNALYVFLCAYYFNKYLCCHQWFETSKLFLDI